MAQPNHTIKISRQQVIILLCLGIALYIIVPQIGDFSKSFAVLRHPAPSWTAGAIVLTLVTYLLAAATYQLLAFKPLRYREILLVQLAAMFINRLVPAGIGAVGTNYVYLRHRRHSAVQAGSMVALNNLLGLLGHGLLISILLLAYGTALKTGSIPAINLTLTVVVSIAAGLVITILFVYRRQKLLLALRNIRRQLQLYYQRPWRVPAALVSSMVLTLCNVACLSACAIALGIHLSFVIVFLIFTFGVGSGAVTPTPGGLGGFEAGLAAGLVAYDVPQATALAIALLYRLVSYWLPLILGGIAFVICQRRKLLTV